jgi:hypothetical protein
MLEEDACFTPRSRRNTSEDELNAWTIGMATFNIPFMKGATREAIFSGLL